MILAIFCLANTSTKVGAAKNLLVGVYFWGCSFWLPFHHQPINLEFCKIIWRNNCELLKNAFLNVKKGFWRILQIGGLQTMQKIVGSLSWSKFRHKLRLIAFYVEGLLCDWFPNLENSQKWRDRCKELFFKVYWWFCFLSLECKNILGKLAVLRVLLHRNWLSTCRSLPSAS